MGSNPGRFLRTIVDLKPRQIAHQIARHLPKRSLQKISSANPPGYIPLQLTPSIPKRISYTDRRFTFLSQCYDANTTPIDWDFVGFSALWTFNLNYFDFLNQDGIPKNEADALIADYCARSTSFRTSTAAYPASLRIINWIKYFARERTVTPEAAQHLYQSALRIAAAPEYDLMANHLLENAFGMLFAAYAFRDPFLYKTARALLVAQLEEQLTVEGAHVERSVMYHQILLDRLLDCVNLLQNNPWQEATLLDTLREKAEAMLRWLHAVVFADGSIPLFNDAAFDIAPTTSDITAYANRLGVTANQAPFPLERRDYLRYRSPAYEMIIDCAPIGPHYQPGHAHADTFSFELRHKGQPCIVDTGTSTYETCTRRMIERSTAAHNTVKVGNTEQSEVWASFRVGRKASITAIDASTSHLRASHDGYAGLNIIHTRGFRFAGDSIAIDDVLSGDPVRATAYFHLAPGLAPHILSNGMKVGDLHFSFSNATTIRSETYHYAPRFNELQEAHCIVVEFYRYLRTRIAL